MPHDSAAANLLSPTLLARLERLELVTRKIFRGRLKGERRSRRLGQSVEFADYRNYVPGDDLRFLDWNLFARLDKLFLRLFLEEEDLHFFAVLDASASMDFGSPTKLQYARQLAAALGFVGLVRADRVQLAVLGGTPRETPPLRGRHQLRRLLDQLADIQPGRNVPLAPSLRDFCLRHPTKGILVLLTDLLDKQGFEPVLQPLVAQRMDVYVVHILSRDELEPRVQGDLRLVDSEDQAVVDVTVSRPLLDRYQQTLRRFLDGARLYCHRRGLNYLLTPTDLPVEEVVTRYLRRRGLVR